ncbi:ABC transporter substrate-binding protein [Ferruginivarius sediminum]|uniref:ABC transporter substrate-binding protein n=1 Tax=Ferruginivarius sediminum TaxID=2661937 RepID=A0A369TBK9_9PROT|nr:ABC transporter substrate-binding protein [Ferruginivarius sediminum]
MFVHLGRRLALSLLMVIVVSFGSVATAQDNDSFRLVRLSYSTGWDALPVVVAVERGFFTRQRLIVSGVAANSAGAVAQSLQANSTDIAVLPQRAFISLAAAGTNAKAIAVNSWGTQMQLVAPPNSGISTIKDLKGRTVAVGEGSAALPFLMRILNLEGLSPDSVRILQMPADQLATALPDGRADAVFDMGHITGPIIGAGQAKAVLNPQDVQKNLGAVGAMPVLASGRFIKNEPEVAQRVVNAWLAAQRYIHENPKDSAQLLRIFLHRHGVTVPEQLVANWIGLQRYDKLHEWTDNAIKDAEYNAWGLKQAGAIKEIPKLGGFVDNRFVKQAMKQIATN